MVVKVSKPELNLREKISELDKPSGVAGEAMLRAETPQEQFNLIGAGRRNLLINGDFQVSQRGDYTTAGTAPNAYVLDRWLVDRNGTATVQHTSGHDIPGSPAICKAVKLVQTVTGTNYLGVRQKIENPGQYIGRTFTYSAWIKSNTPNARIECYIPGTTPNMYFGPSHSGNGKWEYLSFTFTLNTGTPTAFHADVFIDNGAYSNVTLTAGEYVEATMLQLELGKVATSFEHRSYGEELALCMRYFEHCNGNGSVPVNGSSTTTYGAGCVGLAPVLLWHNASFQGRPKVNFIAPKRVPPTVTRIGNSSGQFGYMTTGTAAPNGINTILFSSAIGIASITTTGFHINNQLTGLPIWGVGGGWIASAEL